MSHNTSSNGVSPERPASPSPDNHEEPVDDNNNNDWVDIPDNNAPPHDPSSKKVAPKQIPRLDDSDDDAGLPEVTGVVSWAKRNPGKHTIPLRVQRKRVMGPEQCRTSKDRAKNKKSRKAALYAEIAALNNERNEMLPALAKKHGFKVKLVQQRMAAASTYKKGCKVSMYRAKLHYLSKLLNKGWYFVFAVDSCGVTNEFRT
jgi:hypothetical protein